MNRRKCDLLKLEALTRDEPNLTYKEKAKRLGVSVGAVYKNCKLLGFAKTVVNLTPRIAKRIQATKLDAMETIQNNHLVTQKQIEDIQAELEKASGEQEAGLRQALLPWVAESRKQVGQWADIFRTLQYERDLQNFQESVLNFLEKISPEARSDFLRQFEERNLARGILQRGEPAF